MSFLSARDTCKDCAKEYNYAPEYKHSIFKSKYVKTLGYCGMDCFMKQDKKDREISQIHNLVSHHLDLITKDKDEMKNKTSNKEYL
tara:strand:+ start:1113 stop:1370 length:258 start_codon:yes stop_codon:yes gene_type:complete